MVPKGDAPDRQAAPVPVAPPVNPVPLLSAVPLSMPAIGLPDAPAVLSKPDPFAALDVSTPAMSPPAGSGSPGYVAAPFRRLGSRVMFTPFKLNLWRAGAGPLGDVIGQVEGDLDDIQLVTGKYILTFNYTVPDGRALESSSPIPFDIMGKRAVIQKFKIDPAGSKFILQIHLMENPVPLIALILAGAAAVGIAGYSIYNALESLDRVVVDVTDSALWLGIAGAIGYVGYRVLFKR